jgi:hypothetical protein
MPDYSHMAVAMSELSFLTLPYIGTLRQIHMAGMVAPTWQYMTISGFVNVGDATVPRHTMHPVR